MSPDGFETHVPRRSPRSRSSTLSQRAAGTTRTVGRALWPYVGHDIAYLIVHARLFVGLTLLIVGFLSFASDHYCDGVMTRGATCTRPATYYFYPWWAILLILAGTFLVTLWWLRRVAPLERR